MQSDVTRILNELSERDAEQAAGELLPLVYEELHRLAAARLAREKPGQTWQTSDLVHEAYVRLVGHGHISFNGRAHFFGAAAEAMRRILIERARQRMTWKRGRDVVRVPLDTDVAPIADDQDNNDDKLLYVDEVLKELDKSNPRTAQLVKLRFFGGLTNREIAELLCISTATVERDWRFARAFLKASLDAKDDL